MRRAARDIDYRARRKIISDARGETGSRGEEARRALLPRGAVPFERDYAEMLRAATVVQMFDEAR